MVKVYNNSTTNIYKAFYLEDREWHCDYRKGIWTHKVFSPDDTTLEKAYLHQITIEDRVVECPMCIGRGVRHWVIEGCSGPRDDPCCIKMGCPLCDVSGMVSKELYAAFMLIAPEAYIGTLGTWRFRPYQSNPDQWMPDQPKIIAARVSDAARFVSEDMVLLGVQVLARKIGKRKCA